MHTSPPPSAVSSSCPSLGRSLSASGQVPPWSPEGAPHQSVSFCVDDHRITCWPLSSQVAYGHCSVPGMYPTCTKVHRTHHILTNDFSSITYVPHLSYNGTRWNQPWPLSVPKPSNARTPQREQSLPSFVCTQTRRCTPLNYSSRSSPLPYAAPLDFSSEILAFTLLPLLFRISERAEIQMPTIASCT